MNECDQEPNGPWSSAPVFFGGDAENESAGQALLWYSITWLTSSLLWSIVVVEL